LTRDGLFMLCAKSIKLRPNNGGPNAVHGGLRGLEPRKPMVTIPLMTDEDEAAAASTPERASSSPSYVRGGRFRRAPRQLFENPEFWRLDPAQALSFHSPPY